MKNFNFKTLLLAIGLVVASVQPMWADNYGWNSPGASVEFNKDGSTWWYDYKTDNGDQDLGTITSSLKITNLYLKVWDEWPDDAFSLGQMGYNWGTTEDQYLITDKRGNYSGNNWEMWKENCSLTIASATDKSGKYSFYHWFQIWGQYSKNLYLKHGDNNYKITYTILPPAITEDTYTVSITGDDVKAGSGTEVDPYIIKYGGQMHVSISAQQKHSDANSLLNLVVYKDSKDIDAEGTSLDIKNITNTTASHMYVKGYYKNGDLKGAQKEKAIYYKAETLYTVSVGKTTGGTVSPDGNQSVGAYTSKTLTATNNTGYHFVNWTTTGGANLSTTDAATTTLTASAAGTVTANFAINNYTITYSPAKEVEDKHFTYTTAPDNADYNTNVAMEFTPDQNYVIAGVSAYKTGDKNTAVTVNNPSTNNYNFIQPPYDVTVEVSVSLSQVDVTYDKIGNGDIIGKVGGTDIGASPAKVNGGSTVVFTATPNTGYHVVAWYTNADCTEGEHDNGATSYTISNINADANVYVKFAANTTTVTLDPKGGTGGSSSVTATYDAEMPTATMPTRIGYTFNGYFDAETGGTQYYTNTGASACNWDKPDANITLYAQWTEKMYNNIAVVPNSTDKGSVSVSSVSFGYTTKSASITATPKAGYYFTGWTLPANATYASGDQTSTTITVKASSDDAVTDGITANFAERWGLVGSLEENGNPHGGMPGWTDANAAIFTVNNGNITLDLTLEPNKTYKFQIYDKKSNGRHGCTAEGEPAVIKVGNAWTLDNSKDVRLRTVGHGTYTFTIDNTTADPKDPKISYTAPISHLINMGPKTDKGDGGTITAVDGDNFTIFDGKYVKNGGSVTFTATPKTGYSFAGFYSDAECTSTKLSDDNPYTISNISTNTAVYAKFTENLTDVTVFDGKNTTTVQAGVYTHPEITAVQIEGKKFIGWQTVGVTVANSSAKTTNINSVTTTVNTHTVTATYGDLDIIYFNNQISGTWNPSEMYVYFYHNDYPQYSSYGVGSAQSGDWKDGDETVHPTCQDWTPFPMTKIEGTDIWECRYDKTKFAYPELGIKGVVFLDKNQSADRFSNCAGVYRMDFNECMNMYVCTGTSGETRGSGAYYRNTGFWKNYDAANAGLYLKIENVTGDDGQAFDTKEGPDSYSTSLHLNTESAGASTYNFYLYISSCNGSQYSRKDGQITSDQPSIDFLKWGTYPTTGEKVTLHATATGSYKFIVTHNNDNTLTLRVEYPVCVGDFRVVSVIGGKAHDNGYIYRSSTTEVEMASFFVDNGATVKLQKCTAISGANVTWSDVTGQSISISGLDKPGYYNYTITHNGANASIAAAGEYHGNFYLRTDVAPGGWSNYLTNAGNIMQENEYGTNDAQSFKFTHAYTNHVGHGGNVKFVIANDYSKCITDTLVKDNFITDNAGNLPSGKDANVRFMWNKDNNTVARAYIGGSANISDRYLVLLGNTTTINDQTKHLMVDENEQPFNITGLNPDEAIFKDLGNWVYQVNIKAFSGAAVKLMADFAGKTQYFVGADGEEEGSRRQIMAGESTESFPMRVVYDFKSNRLVAGFVPDGNDITGNIVLNGDLLILREMQESAKQIKFGAAAQDKDPYSISKIDHIYCGLQINKGDAEKKDGMIGSSNNDYAKTMYWISFPFDVNINEIFGLDGYGQKWIIQKYNGQKRADIGWFKGDGTETFWEFMDYNETMKAYEGYLFLIDANYFNETNDKVWEIGTVDHITFYFPSANGNIGIINQSSFTQPVPAHKCSIDREFSIGTDEKGNDIIVNHKNTDSYWNVIGVPAFQNKTMALSNTEVDTKMKAIYQWNSTYNTYDVVALQNNFEFKTMYAYMVQFGGDITWSDVSVVNNPTLAQGGPAPRYAYADEKNYMIELFFNGNGAEDHTYINLAEEANIDFVLNEDMMKLDNAGFPNIYSFAGNYNVAYNETKMENQSVMLGVSAPKDGTYTFSMPKEFSGTAKLVDLVEGTTTDLNVSDYSVDLTKGTYNNRFQLVLEVKAQAPTSIMNVDGGLMNVDGKTKKLLRNGNIYLINSGRVYNATGAKLR